MILGSVSSKFSAQILPRTVTSVCGPHWWSGGGGLATARVTNTGERKAGHRLLSNVSENRPARFSIFSRNISSFDHAESNSVVNACQQSCHSISLIQANRYTTQSPGADGEVKSNPSPHFKTRKNLAEKSGKASTEDIQTKDVRPGSHDYLLPHPIWSEEELDAVQITHNPPKENVDKAAYWACKALRTNFDLFSGFTWGKRTERKWIYRIIFLETVAGVPGMVAAMSRHLRSLRRMQRDHGWIHTLLEEAENERMHLMTALEIKQPSMFFRLMVLGAQGIFVNIFFISYLISPKFCHRFVGYLEEEAVITYTKLLKDLREDALPKWKDKIAPEISINYWKLQPDADYIDLFRAIRADEAHHREVNHTLSDIKPDEPNPFGPGK